VAGCYGESVMGPTSAEKETRGDNTQIEKETDNSAEQESKVRNIKAIKNHDKLLSPNDL
jgi:hypothetical protein